MACSVRVSASDDRSAVAVAATVATVRVDTDDVMLARARKVVLLVNSLLSCELFLALPLRKLRASSEQRCRSQRWQKLYNYWGCLLIFDPTAVVVPVVAALLPPLKRTEFI